ncbi:MAG: stage II sporulation protein M [Candidatus Geothermarchaeales archaeon]
MRLGGARPIRPGIPPLEIPRERLLSLRRIPGSIHSWEDRSDIDGGELVEQASYLHSIRKYVIFSFVLFLAFLFLGYALAGVLEFGLLDLLREVFGDVGDGGFDPLFVFTLVFTNNAVKSFFAILLGVLFGVASGVFIVVNGFIIGIFVFEVEQEAGIAFVAAGLLPHGIIEIPAVLVSAAVGLRLGYELVRHIRGRGHIDREFKRGMRFFLRYLVPLLLFAAFVEAFLTPIIVELVI